MDDLDPKDDELEESEEGDEKLGGETAPTAPDDIEDI